MQFLRFVAVFNVLLLMSMGRAIAADPADTSKATASCSVGFVHIATMTEPRVYATRFTSSQPGLLDAHFVAYTNTRGYEFDVKGLALNQDSSDRSVYESAPVFFRLPTADVLFAAELTGAGDRTACSGFRRTPSMEPASPPKSDEDLRAALAPGKSDINDAKAEPGSFACDTPFADATIVTFVPPVYPETARQRHESGSAIIKVMLAPDGHVVSTSVFRSSDSIGLDAAAGTAAAQSTYQAEVWKCKPIGGSYMFRADFAHR